MNIFKKIISSFIVFLLLLNSFSIVSWENDIASLQKTLVLYNNELKKIKNWDKYIKQIETALETIKDDQEALKKLNTRLNELKTKTSSKSLMILINYLISYTNYYIALNEDESWLYNDVYYPDNNIYTGNTNKYEDISETEKNMINEKIKTIQMNLFNKWKNYLENITSEFEKITNVEEKWDLNLKLNITYPWITNSDLKIDLNNYTAKTSNFDSQISWDLEWYIKSTSLNWYDSDIDLSFKWFLDYIQKDWDMYLLLKNFNIDDKIINNEIKPFIEWLKEKISENKYLKIEDKETKQFFEYLNNLSLSNIESYVAKPMFEAYKKSWDKYYILPTKHFCDTAKEIENVFDPFYWSDCSDSQYKNMISDLEKSWIVFYISIDGNYSTLWFEMSWQQLGMEELYWYITFSESNIEEIYFYVKPDQWKFPWEYGKLEFKNKKYINGALYAEAWDIDIRLKSSLDQENDFSFIDFSWKFNDWYDDINSYLKLENNKITWEYKQTLKKYDRNSSSYIDDWSFVIKVSWGTKSNNELKNINISYNLNSSDETEKLNWEFSYDSNYNRFALKNYYSDKYWKIDMDISFAWDKTNKILTELTSKISISQKSYISWEIQEFFNSDISLKSWKIEWKTSIDWEWFIKLDINTNWEYKKWYLKLNNDFQYQTYDYSYDPDTWEYSYDLAEEKSWGKISLELDTRNNKDNIDLSLEIESPIWNKILEFILKNKAVIEYKNIEIIAPKDYIEFEEDILY